ASLNGGPLTVPAVAGVANFLAFLTLNTAASGYTLQATTSGLTAALTADIVVTALPATRLAVLTEPPSLLTPGSSFGLSVAAEDRFGNIDKSFGGQVSLAPAVGSGAGLSGGTTVTASQGIASFTGLSLSLASGSTSLQVSAAGLTGTTTDPVTVTPPAQLQVRLGSRTVAGDARGA